MGSKTILADLSVDGYTNATLRVTDAMLLDFFFSEYSQTYAWPGKVMSFPWYLARYTDDLTRLCQELQSALSFYFSQQFNEVNVEIDTVPVAENSSRHSLRVYMTFSDTMGETFELARLIQYENLKVTSIMRILSGETT